jgi:hypothetical protein
MPRRAFNVLAALCALTCLGLFVARTLRIGVTEATSVSWVSSNDSTAVVFTHTSLDDTLLYVRNRSIGYGDLIIVFGVVPVLWLVHYSLVRSLRVQRRQHGLCVECGYDLRATPGRCPECGAEPRGAGHAA